MYIKNVLSLKLGDIKSNTGSRKSSALKLFHGNLNDLAAHKFTKLSLIEGYINFNGIDILCLSGAFLIDDNR